jgi:hypothetical protein
MSKLRRSFPFLLLAVLAGLLPAFTLLPRGCRQEPRSVPAAQAPAAVVAAGRRVEVRVRDGGVFTGVLDQDLPASGIGWVIVVQDARRVALPIANVNSVKEI